MTKLILGFVILLLNVELKAQVPNHETILGCVNKSNVGSRIRVSCSNCCEYNSQATENNAVTHKCKSQIDSFCTGAFLPGPCPDCYLIVYIGSNSLYPFVHGILFIPSLNKKWYFNPNATTTTHESNEFEGIINFIPLDGIMEGHDMTAEDLILIDTLNP